MPTRDDDTSELQSLVKLAVQGDRQAFSDIVKRKMKGVIALTYRMTQNREAALDLAQETFLAAWENIGRFRGEAKIDSWLYRIAANKTLNSLAQQKHSSEELVEESHDLRSAGISPQQFLERDELKRGVLEFMAGLPPQQRVAFELRFYQQYSFAEIAEATGKALGTVKTNYREAVKKLRVLAAERGWQ